MFEREGMLARVDGNQDVTSVFRDVLSGLIPAHEKEVLDAHRRAAEVLIAGDLAAYAEVGARWWIGWLVGWFVGSFINLVWFGFGLVLVLVWFGLVWGGLVWCGLVWFGLVWFGLVWFGLV